MQDVANLATITWRNTPGVSSYSKNNSSSAAPSTQVEQLSTIEDEVKSSDSGNSSEGGIEVSNDEDVVDVVVDVNIINDK